MDNWTNDLNEIREAIFRRDWIKCVRTIEHLLAAIPSQSLGIAAHQIVLSQAKFTRDNSTLAWLVQFSNTLSSTFELGFSPERLPSLPGEVELDYSDQEAGLSNLIVAVEELWKAARKVNDPYQCGNLSARALSELITGDLCHYWANVHPEEWQLRELFWNAETAPEGTKILPDSVDRAMLTKGIRFAFEPEAIGYKAAKWLLIVDEIETQLAR